MLRRSLAEVDDIREVFGSGIVKLVARREGWTAEQLGAVVAGCTGEEAHHTSSGSDWVELSAFGITKAYGLSWVCEHLDVHVDEVAACGDNLNDLSMLAFAGLGCAVRNGEPETLATADVILPSNLEEGVADLLEALVAALEVPAG